MALAAKRTNNTNQAYIVGFSSVILT